MSPDRTVGAECRPEEFEDFDKGRVRGGAVEDLETDLRRRTDCFRHGDAM